MYKNMDSTNKLMLTPSDYETHAYDFIDPATLAYIAGGAGREKTLRNNTAAFESISLIPRAFADFNNASTHITLLGKRMRHPIMLAPVAAQSLVNPMGEIATAQAANAFEAGMIVSSLCSKPLSEVANATDQTKWFQLYFQPTRALTKVLLDKAIGAGFEAIVVTLDTHIQSLSKRAQMNGFVMPDHALPVNLASAAPSQEIEITQDESVIFQGLMQTAPSLKEITWLQDYTDLPIIIKGVLASDEIDQLLAMGIDGLIVSNHGGRALDCTPSTLSLLPDIRKQVGHDFPLLFDSGIRSGHNVFKALALGADAVCIGRLQMYALAANGAHGVAHLLKLLRDELELCMALTGCPTIADIDTSRVMQEACKA